MRKILIFLCCFCFINLSYAATSDPNPLDPGAIPGDDLANICKKFLSKNRWYKSSGKCIINGKNVVKNTAIRTADCRYIRATTMRCDENGIQVFIEWNHNGDSSYALGFIAPEHTGANTLVLNFVSASRYQKECVGSYAYRP